MLQCTFWHRQNMQILLYTELIHNLIPENIADDFILQNTPFQPYFVNIVYVVCTSNQFSGRQ